jgi:hypothetical protein
VSSFVLVWPVQMRLRFGSDDAHRWTRSQDSENEYHLILTMKIRITIVNLDGSTHDGGIKFKCYQQWTNLAITLSLPGAQSIISLLFDRVVDIIYLSIFVTRNVFGGIPYSSHDHGRDPTLLAALNDTKYRNELRSHSLQVDPASIFLFMPLDRLQCRSR